MRSITMVKVRTMVKTVLGSILSPIIIIKSGKIISNLKHASLCILGINWLREGQIILWFGFVDSGVVGFNHLTISNPSSIALTTLYGIHWMILSGKILLRSAVGRKFRQKKAHILVYLGNQQYLRRSKLIRWFRENTFYSDFVPLHICNPGR